METITTPPAHTRGAWFAYFDEDDDRWSVHAGSTRGRIEFNHELAVLTFKGNEAAADARLMAAGPMMLDALRVASDVVRDVMKFEAPHSSDYHAHAWALSVVNAAIAEATHGQIA